MFKKFLTLFVVAIFMLFGEIAVTSAEKHEVTASGEYTYGDKETREDAKKAALEDAKRNALEKIVVYVQSQSVVDKSKLTADTIRSHSAGKLQILDREFQFVGDKMLTCIATIKAAVEIDMNELQNNPASTNALNPPTSNPNSGGEVTKSKILDGAIELNGHYYKNFEIKLNWDSAKKFCESVGGHLVISESDDEIDILQKLSKKGSQTYWIGGYRDDDGLWRWLNGVIVMGNHWHPGEPPGGSSSNRMSVRDWTNGKWITDSANEVWAFICEWESGGDAHDSTL